MSTNLNRLLATNGAVRVSYDTRGSDKHYDYFIPGYIDFNDIEVGDRVIVKSPYTGYTTVTVEGKSKDTSWVGHNASPIISRVDVSEYERWDEKRIAIEQELVMQEFRNLRDEVLAGLDDNCKSKVLNLLS